MAMIGLPAPALVIGASGGIGAALVGELENRQVPVQGLSRREHGLDITCERSIAELVATMDAPRLVIVATGLLHDGEMAPEKTFGTLTAAQLAQSFAVNTIGPALLAKHLLPRMPREGRTVFAVLSARVGSIADNRLGGWYSYRASKAALNQLVRTLAIERSRQAPDAVILALHPGTVATVLSAPFRRGDEAFTAAQAATHLLDVIASADSAQSGAFLAWDGTAIPY